MRIIISPAKQMRNDKDILSHETLPVFRKEAEEILGYLRTLSYDELKAVWCCNEKIASENYERVNCMDLAGNLSPAVLSYDGIAFKYMAPGVFLNDEFSYVQDNLRILSGFYGALKPMDGVTPYRLEMQSKAMVNGTKDLYHFWDRKIYDEVMKENTDRVIINLASKEYSKCVEKYITSDDHFYTMVFGEEEKEKIIQKGVYCKMARGEMVRFMAEKNVKNVEELKEFNRLNFSFRADLSTESTYVFVRNCRKQ